MRTYLIQTSFPEIPEEPYDLIVLGSGPAGETAGCKAAQLGATVAIIEVKKVRAWSAPRISFVCTGIFCFVLFCFCFFKLFFI